MASRHRAIVRKRTCWLFLIFAIAYLAIVARLVQVQIINKPVYKEWARKFRVRDDLTIPASRGDIYDRNGRLLATSLDTVSIFANKRELKDANQAAVKVAAILGQDAKSLREKLSDDDRKFVWLGKQVDARIGDKVRRECADLPGVGVQRDMKRVYPAGMLAAQILGFTNIDNKGVEGIEATLNHILSGTNGKMRAELDDERRIIPETRHIIKKPKNGSDVYLTIDLTIQHIAEQALAKMAEQYKPQFAHAIVLDPHSGEILALANYPTYDPNNARSVKSSLWRNRAVSDLYEPGSTLKVVTVAAGLNEGMSKNTIVCYCKGREKIKGGYITCTLHEPFLSGHGATDLNRVIEHSCNIGAAHIGMTLGREKLYSYLKSFGLLDKPGSGFSGEAVGWMNSPKNWQLIRLANIAFGQGIAVTPLQMACVYSTIANGGIYVRPRIVREVRDPDGNITKPFKPIQERRVISERAASELTKMLVSCVENGTGKNARIEGRSVAGKTGSAQVARAGGRGYEPGAYVSSFMGFVPASSPRLVIAVVVHRPKGSHWGATVAAPVFKEVGEKALWYLRVPADKQPEMKPKIKTKPASSKQLV